MSIKNKDTTEDHSIRRQIPEDLPMIIKDLTYDQKSSCLVNWRRKGYHKKTFKTIETRKERYAFDPSPNGKYSRSQ